MQSQNTETLQIIMLLSLLPYIIPFGKQKKNKTKNSTTLKKYYHLVQKPASSKLMAFMFQILENVNYLKMYKTIMFK